MLLRCADVPANLPTIVIAAWRLAAALFCCCIPNWMNAFKAKLDIRCLCFLAMDVSEAKLVAMVPLMGVSCLSSAPDGMISAVS